MTDREGDIPVTVQGESLTPGGEESAPVESASPPEGTAIPEAAAQQGQAPTEDWQDRYLRLAAEFDNYRKRSARDFGELVRNAERDLMAEVTEVLDNFGRALDTDHKGESVTHFAKGMAQIREQLWAALTKRGLERMETVGTPFDPNQHDAMVRMPSDKFAEGIVMQEVSPGYRLGNKVLRYARVVVSQGKAETSGTAADDAGDSV